MDVSESFITVPLPIAEPPDSPLPKQVTDIKKPDQGHKKKPVTTSSRKMSKKASKKQEKKKSDATPKLPDIPPPDSVPVRNRVGYDGFLNEDGPLLSSSPIREFVDNNVEPSIILLSSNDNIIYISDSSEC